MKALLSLLLVCPFWVHAQTSLNRNQNQLSLIVAPSQPGRVDDHTIDVTQLPDGAAVRVQVQLNNFNVTLAGAEFVLQFPSHTFSGGPLRMRATDGDFQGNNPPVIAHSDWGTPNLMVLPIDQNGFRNASHVSLAYGRVRFGAVFRDPSDRLVGSGGNITVAEFEFFLGNDTVANCISSLLAIDLIQCNTGANSCDYFSDELGNRIQTGTTAGGLRVSLINSSATYPKGDINKDGIITNQDVGPMLQCAFYGQESSGCPLSGMAQPEYEQIADFNCSGAVTNQDVGPLLNYSVGQDGDFKTALVSQELKQAGVVGFDFEGAIGSAAVIEGSFNGSNPSLADLQFANPDQANYWEIISSFNPEQQRLVAIVVSRDRSEAVLPTLTLPYASARTGNVLQLHKVQRLDANDAPMPLPVNLFLDRSPAEQQSALIPGLNTIDLQGGDR